MLFAHGSGSSRHSPRNRHVAGVLAEAGLATLLMDLLTVADESVDCRTGRLRFDIALLAGRLVAATSWLAAEPPTRELPVGYFGARTGAGAALMAAAQHPELVRAIVFPRRAARSRGPRARARRGLIVGGHDLPVIGMNRDAMAFVRRGVGLNGGEGSVYIASGEARGWPFGSGAGDVRPDASEDRSCWCVT